MNLLTKFSLVFSPLSATGLGVAGVLFQKQLQDTAREQVLHQAQIMMETALAMRAYTSEQVKPLVTTLQGAPRPELPQDSVFHDLCMRKLAVHREFRPQTVPAFAATEMFDFLRQEVPRVPRQGGRPRPVQPPRSRGRLGGGRRQGLSHPPRARPPSRASGCHRRGPSLYLARPMRAGKACLERHSTPAAAPPRWSRSTARPTGSAGRRARVIAAQIVSVPVAVTVRRRPGVPAAGHLARRGGGLDAGVAQRGALPGGDPPGQPLRRPGRRYPARGTWTSPSCGHGQATSCRCSAAAFNRMHRSLVAAMKLLEQARSDGTVPWTSFGHCDRTWLCSVVFVDIVDYWCSGALEVGLEGSAEPLPGAARSRTCRPRTASSSTPATARRLLPG